MKPLFGYRRPNGQFGSRNHVLILPVDDLSNAACVAVANTIRGTLPLPHPYGRLQYGADLELHFDTLIGAGRNPNVASVVVIGIEPTWTKRMVDGIAASGKPVIGFAIERTGDLGTIAKASRAAMEFVQQATEARREEFGWGEVTISIKCGESDTTSGLASNPAVGEAVDQLVDVGATVIFGETSELTGGEQLIADRCATPELRASFLKMFNDYVGFIESRGVSLLGSQPTEGNIIGGLTTIEEKAFGNIEKTGTKPVIGVLRPAQAPTKKGLCFMDTSSAAAEFITLMAAAGSTLHLFTTGQGNIIGNPLVPVVKITANPLTLETMSEHIDVDVTGLLTRKMSLSQSGSAIIEMIERTYGGRLTAAEALKHDEFVLTKLYPSA